MSAQERQDLIDSITNIGVQNAITLFDGMVIDGWHRYSIATDMGMACPECELPTDVDPRDFVLAQNKARRNLTASQRAAATAAVYGWRPMGKPAANSAPGAELAKSAAEMAAIAGVSTRTMEQAKAVQAHASPEVRAAVKAGDVSVKKAAAVAHLPPEQQAEALTAPTPARPAAPRPPPPLPAPGPAAPAVEQADSLQQELEALREQLDATNAQLATLDKVLDADDQLAAAVADAKAQRVLAQALQGRLDSMMTEIADLKREVKRWQRKAEKAGVA